MRLNIVGKQDWGRLSFTYFAFTVRSSFPDSAVVLNAPPDRSPVSGSCFGKWIRAGGREHHRCSNDLGRRRIDVILRTGELPPSQGQDFQVRVTD
jgi:hypothetical protein